MEQSWAAQFGRDWKVFSETAANFAEALGILGAVFVLWNWMAARRDRSTEVLFELENRFQNPSIQAGCRMVEEDDQYKAARLALIEEALPPDELGAGRENERAGWRSSLAPLDALLRFYVLLLGVRRAHQVKDQVLATCFRFWLAHYFHPCRRELRLYIAHFFPTLHLWLQRDSAPWYRRLSGRFFCPERFGWPTRRNFDRSALQRAATGKVFVITGAGVSAESGIPTYRGKEGFWRQRNPRQLATRAAFSREPGLIWEWYSERRAKIIAAEHSIGHQQLVALAQRAKQFLLVTQNVDDLHERAGTKREHLVHIHGEILFNRCLDPDCGHRDGAQVQPGQVPACPRCGQPLRPDVIWFDEELHPDAVGRVTAFLDSGDVDLAIVVGTSSGFSYIVDWALRALGDSGWLVEVNPFATPLSAAADRVIRSGAGQGLSRLLAESAPPRPGPSSPAAART